MFNNLATLLQEEIESTLGLITEKTGLYDLARESCTKACLVEVGSPVKPWHLLPLIICQTVSGGHNRAVPAAAALLFLKSAAEVFDDIEDDDSPDSLFATRGRAVATNVATTLLILAEIAVTRLKDRGVREEVVVQVMNQINSYHLEACIGQHLDISVHIKRSVTEDEYLKIIKLKSAKITECACHVGALIGDASPELVDIYSSFGYLLGMASQIENDVQDFISGGASVKSQINLPLIYALHNVDDETACVLKKSLKNGTSSGAKTVQEILFQSGSIQYALIKANVFQQQAAAALFKAEATGLNTDMLRTFVD